MKKVVVLSSNVDLFDVLDEIIQTAGLKPILTSDPFEVIEGGEDYTALVEDPDVVAIVASQKLRNCLFGGLDVLVEAKERRPDLKIVLLSDLMGNDIFLFKMGKDNRPENKKDLISFFSFNID